MGSFDNINNGGYRDHLDPKKKLKRLEPPDPTKRQFLRDLGQGALIAATAGAVVLGLFSRRFGDEKKKDELDLSTIETHIGYLERLQKLSDEDLGRLVEVSRPNFPDDPEATKVIEELNQLKYPMAIRQFRDEIGKIINQLHADQREIILKLHPLSATDANKDEKTKPYPAQML